MDETRRDLFIARSILAPSSTRHVSWSRGAVRCGMGGGGERGCFALAAVWRHLISCSCPSIIFRACVISCCVIQTPGRFRRALLPGEGSAQALGVLWRRVGGDGRVDFVVLS